MNAFDTDYCFFIATVKNNKQDEVIIFLGNFVTMCFSLDISTIGI